jgi:hypothetical protein
LSRDDEPKKILIGKEGDGQIKKRKDWISSIKFRF